jgi:hypothetical protein
VPLSGWQCEGECCSVLLSSQQLAAGSAKVTCHEQRRRSWPKA